MQADTRSIEAVAGALRSRTLTSAALTEACLARIEARDRSVNAFICVLATAARADAAAADRELDEGRWRGPLHGIPIALKDLIDMQGVGTTAASRVRRSHVAEGDATVTARLRAAGAVLLGKNNLHEFAFGTTNEDSAYGPVRHPLDPTRSPGGSSGGSAAAVLDGMAFAAIGTDTGGSIRIPAAACGLVGLKPSIGDIPTGGVVPLSTTLDHVGPICRSVADARVIFGALRGEPATPHRSAAPALPARDLRLGVPRRYFLAHLDPGVAEAFEQTCARLRAAGVELEEVEIPHADDIAPVYLHIVLAEAAAYHASSLDAAPDDYTPNVRFRLEMGRYVLAEDYVRALRGRDLLRSEVDAAIDGRDGLLLPSLAVPATPLGADSVPVGNSRQPVRSITLRLTQLFNVSGHPAITMPCGTTADGLPAGAQVVGHLARTNDLLRVAAALEPHVVTTS